jgi:hypothetical protein
MEEEENRGLEDAERLNDWMRKRDSEIVEKVRWGALVEVEKGKEWSSKREGVMV